MDNPFRNPGSLQHTAFELATKGTTFDALRELADGRGGDWMRLLSLLRRGSHKKAVWKVDEQDGAIRVYGLGVCDGAEEKEKREG